MSLIFIPPVSRRTDCPLGGTTPTSYLLPIFLSSEIFTNFPRRFNYCIKSAPNTRYSIYKKAHAPPCIGACARPHACRGSGHALPRRAAPILSARAVTRSPVAPPRYFPPALWRGQCFVFVSPLDLSAPLKRGRGRTPCAVCRNHALALTRAAVAVTRSFNRADCPGRGNTDPSFPSGIPPPRGIGDSPRIMHGKRWFTTRTYHGALT